MKLKPGECTVGQVVSPSVSKLEEWNYAHIKPVWTMTTGRSGTKWLTRLLNHVEALRAVHEPLPCLFNEARLLREGQLDGMTELGWVRLLRATRTQLPAQASARAMRYVECSPLMTPLVPYLRKAFPDSQVIHLVRDPRAFAVSAASRGWCQRPHIQDHWFPKPPDWVDKVLPKDPLIARVLWLWNDTHEQALALEDDDTHRIRAEDMWADVDAACELLAFLGVPGEVCERMGELIAGLQGQRVNVGRGKRWRRRWDKALEQLCPVAGEFGYL